MPSIMDIKGGSTLTLFGRAGGGILRSLSGPLAQLEEQLTLNQLVPGSSPGRPPRGEVSELVDEHDLGSCAERHGGSSPPFPTRPRHR